MASLLTNIQRHQEEVPMAVIHYIISFSPISYLLFHNSNAVMLEMNHNFQAADRESRRIPPLLEAEPPRKYYPSRHRSFHWTS